MGLDNLQDADTSKFFWKAWGLVVVVVNESVARPTGRTSLETYPIHELLYQNLPVQSFNLGRCCWSSLDAKYFKLFRECVLVKNWVDVFTRPVR